jgi:hypothetical protein
MNAPALVNPALELLRDLDGGALFTPWARHRSGQEISAVSEAINPPCLFGWEAGVLRVAPHETYAALRRDGDLVLADGTKVSRSAAIVAAAHVSRETFRLLTATRTPVGTALAAQAQRDGTAVSSVTLWSAPGTDEYAVHCCRLVLLGDTPAAIATDHVLWSWLALPPAGQPQETAVHRGRRRRQPARSR